jgi:hypothetical protein
VVIEIEATSDLIGENKRGLLQEALSTIAPSQPIFGIGGICLGIFWRAVDMIQNSNEYDCGEQHEMRSKKPEHQGDGKIVCTHPQTVVVARTIQMNRDISAIDVWWSAFDRNVDLVSHMIE